MRDLGVLKKLYLGAFFAIPAVVRNTDDLAVTMRVCLTTEEQEN